MREGREKKRRTSWGILGRGDGEEEERCGARKMGISGDDLRSQ